MEFLTSSHSAVSKPSSFRSHQKTTTFSQYNTIQESCATAKMTMRCTLYQCLSVSSRSQTRVKLNRFLAYPKFSHVPLAVGGWRFGSKKRRCWDNCPCNHFPRFPTYVITLHQRDRRTDRQHAIPILRYAL